MRTLALLGAALLAASLHAAASHPPSVGPYSGTVREGETDSFVYDNNPHDDPCIDVMATYTVVLTYVPTTDTLALTVGGQTVVGSGGSASVTFGASYCTSFGIQVTGVDVADVATYTVTVERNVGEIA